jgi:FMN phosphatase YigB (HAD superfamily)
MITYVFFDVAGTLLGKPQLFERYRASLLEHGYDIDINRLKFTHKLLSEVIHFPDKTDRSFYNFFNTELLLCLGITPADQLLETIFNNCTYLPWEAFIDSNVLKDINLSIGIISNFNSSLKTKLQNHFGNAFSDVFVSEEVGLAKPDIAFYKWALNQVGVPAEEVIYVGDSMKLDIVPAQSLGIRSLLIDRDGYFPQSPYSISSLHQLINHLH